MRTEAMNFPDLLQTKRQSDPSRSCGFGTGQKSKAGTKNDLKGSHRWKVTVRFVTFESEEKRTQSYEMWAEALSCHLHSGQLDKNGTAKVSDATGLASGDD